MIGYLGFLAAQTDDESIDPDAIADGNVSFRENTWLDQYEFHFGEWVKQIVDWVDINLTGLLDAFIWPFEFLFRLIMNTDESASSIMSLPWYWVAIVFFLVGSVVRNTRIGLMAGVLVAACGLLGPDYWSETTKTFGMIFVSVLLCAIMGIPLGVLCGRVDSVWNAVRPVLDAMQVIHPFVYMLPFVFFWGAGEESATMATLVFALPPLVRLTNLGIRQVPSDVVEASRAFGANELRVMTDVQLPLARPAIMTGLNQTLLMAISMLGIAAIMGAGGLGKLLLQAISSNNLPQATSGGLAYFFVAIVLDRITQRESTDGRGLFSRVSEAWSLRRDPEALLAAQEGREAAAAAEEIVAQAATFDESDAPVDAGERTGLLLGAVGMVVAVVSGFLTWGQGAGLVSGWGRRADETELAGQSFMGIEASGGSMFGVLVVGLSIIGIMCAVRPIVGVARTGAVPALLNRVQGLGLTLLMGFGLSMWLFNIFNDDFGAWLDGAETHYNRFWTVLILLAGIALGEYLTQRLIGRSGAFIVALAIAAVVGFVAGADSLTTIGILIFAFIALAMAAETFVRGTPRMGADGLVIVAVPALATAIGYFLTNGSPATTGYSHGIGVSVALIGTALAVFGGLMALFRAPYTSRIPLKLDVKWPLIIAAAAVFISMWAALIAPWSADARLDTLMTPELTAEIQRLRDDAGDDINKQIANGQAITNLISSAQAEPIVFNGIEGDGPRLGWPTIVFAGAAVLTTLMAAGLLGGSETHRWRWGAITTALGLAAIAIPGAWIASFSRTAEPRATTGNGSFFIMVLAFVFFAIGRGVVANFRRRKIYTSSDSTHVDLTLEAPEQPELLGAPGA